MRTIVCAAGLGSRLGFNIPKCLVRVDNKSIIRRQLEILTQLECDVVVVAGFKFDLVVKEIKDFKIEIARNDRYDTTSVVDSVKIGISGASEIITVDGDTLFTLEDMNKLVGLPSGVVCVKKNISNDSPVYVTTSDNDIVSFHRDRRTDNDLEWAGICKVPATVFDSTDQFVYQALERHLPLRHLLIDSAEIDTVEDLEEANKWIRR